jgi:hypothetical protein
MKTATPTKGTAARRTNNFVILRTSSFLVRAATDVVLKSGLLGAPSSAHLTLFLAPFDEMKGRGPRLRYSRVIRKFSRDPLRRSRLDIGFDLENKRK